MNKLAVQFLQERNEFFVSLELIEINLNNFQASWTGWLSFQLSCLSADEARVPIIDNCCH